jgi:hypothetical protein
MIINAITLVDYRTDRQEFCGLFGDEPVSCWSSLVETVLKQVADLADISGLFVCSVENVFHRQGTVIVVVG